MKPKPILQVEDLRIERGGVLILDSVSWEIQKGQHWVILGANGSGKTSLLKALTGYLMPTAGAITVLGSRYGEADWRELRLKVGMVSSAIRQMIQDEESALETVVSGKFAMVNFWGKIRPADRSRALRILKQVECTHLASRSWGVLSQGERQRILIGRALMAAPRILIVDEPCAGLDPVAREDFLQFIERLGNLRNGPALVFVTHHIEEIMPVFSHVLFLREGALLAAGPRLKVLTSANLSHTFKTRARLSKRKGRYWLRISSQKK